MQDNPDYQISLADEQALLDAGVGLANVLRQGVIVYLQGDLGAGKTTLCKGILTGLGFEGNVKSPTYTLVEPYDLDRVRVYHFDLYRLGDPTELEYIGLRDYFDGLSMCLVEWPEQGEGVLPAPDLAIRLDMQGRGRLLRCRAGSDTGRAILQDWKKTSTVQ